MKKLALAAIAVILIINIPFLMERIDYDDNNKNYELIIDSAEFNDLTLRYKQLNLSELVKAGLTGLALPADTIEDLIDSGQVALWRSAEISTLSEDLRTKLETEDYNIDSNGALLYFDGEVARRLESILDHWQETYNVKSMEYENGKIVLFPDWYEELEDLIPGYDQEFAAEAGELGLDLFVRIKNQPDDNLNLALYGEALELGAESVIFSGDEVAGFPGNIEENASFLNEAGLRYGMIEPFIADQDGSREFAEAAPANVVRVHSIQQDEMEKYDVDRIVNRYIRAARDRNVRYLYLRGFPTSRTGEDLAGMQKNLIERISTQLETAGFSAGNVSPLVQAGPANWRLASIIIAIILLLYLFTDKLFAPRMKILVFSLLTAGFLAFSGILISIATGDIFRQFLALGLAVLAPAISSFYIVDILAGKPVFKILQAAGITLAGSIFLNITLAKTEFYNQIESFRGVKVAFLMPLIFTVIYYLLNEYEIKSLDDLIRASRKFLDLIIRLKHIVLAGFVMVGLIIYIGRTGNIPLIPVPAWEIVIRDLLEELLVVRPRFKEFLFGHPFLLLLPVIYKYFSYKFLGFIAVIMATIGQITIANSFSHLHTPLRISLIRTWHGYWLALPVAAAIGLAFYIINRLFIYYVEKGAEL
ncbi:MAG: DUF5693 family protein [Halarsenatibacteraceae bacterium]